MPPIPCSHCAVNFMRTTTDPEAPLLCNNCLVREERRNPKGGKRMEDTVNILIVCPRSIHIEIEEHCISQGIDFSKYFLGLHEVNFVIEREKERLKEVEEKEGDFEPNISEKKPQYVENKPKKVKAGKK